MMRCRIGLHRWRVVPLTASDLAFIDDGLALGLPVRVPRAWKCENCPKTRDER